MAFWQSDDFLGINAKIKLSELSKRLSSNGLSLIIDDEVYDHLAKKTKESGFGARPLDRMIITDIENKIADMMISKSICCGDSIVISVTDEVINCKKMLLVLK